MQENVFLIDAEYSIINNRPVIILYGRTKKKKSVAILDASFKPYFYILPKANVKKLKKEIESLQFYDHEDLIQVKKVEIVKRGLGLEKREVLKVYGYLPQNIPKIKDVVKEWKDVEGKREFDIPFFKRYLLDKQISPLTWIKVDGNEVESNLNVDLVIQAKRIERIEKKEPSLKILAFDLEVMTKKGLFSTRKEAGQKIIFASITTNFGFKKVLSYHKNNFKHSISLKNEKELIEEFIRIVNKEDPDFIITYNGDAFDFPILRERANKYKIRLNLGRDNQQVVFQRKGRISAALTKGRVHIDLYNFVARIMSPTLQSETLTLDNISNEVLGKRKKEMSWDKMVKYWEKKENLDKLADYCLKDSELTLELSEQILPNIFALSKLTNQIPFDTSRMTYGQLVESYLIKEAVIKESLIPNRPISEKIAQRRAQAPYIGAYVIEPKEGIHENLVVMDFRSFHPTIIVSHNIDPYTFDCDCCKKNKVPELGYNFCKKKRGFISSLLEKIINERGKIKQKMKNVKKETQEYRNLFMRQYALKIILNATYGYTGYAGARWYCRECAESVTAFVRDYLHKVAEWAEKEGFIVVYGDTDSLVVKLPRGTIEELKKKSADFLEKVNKKLPGIMELELEEVYLRGLFISAKGEERGAKKRYALIDTKGKVTIRGFEKVRRDWSKLAKDTQEKVLGLVLTNRKDAAVRIVQKTIENLKKEKVDLSELMIYTQVTRSLENYQQIAPHVAAARRAANKGVKILPGDVIPYVITKGKGRISDKAELYQFAKNYDVEYYINNQILPAALRVLKVLGVTEEDLLGKAKQSGLGRFTK